MTAFMDAADLWLPGTIAMGFLILSSGFFSASETAFFYLTHDQIRAFHGGNARQKMVSALMANPDRLLTAVLFWNLVINLLYFSVSVVVVGRLSAADQKLAGAAFGLLSLFVMILLGEVFPKSTAVVLRTGLAPLAAWPLAAAVRVLDPILPPLERVATALRRAFWPRLKREQYLRAEDLEQAIDASVQDDHVVQTERQILHNILDLSEITAEEVMRPRGMYPAIRSPFLVDEFLAAIAESDYLVIHRGTGDEIAAALALDELTTVPAPTPSAEDLAYVPWCGSLALTLQTMRDSYTNVVVVVNEYGETVGIVTWDDILDAIFMSQPSRTRRVLQREPVREIAPESFEVDGITTLRYLARRLGVPFEPTDDGPLTVAGLLHAHLEQFPQPGQQCLWNGWEIRVTESNERGRLKAELSRPTTSPGSGPLHDRSPLS